MFATPDSSTAGGEKDYPDAQQPSCDANLLSESKPLRASTQVPQQSHFLMQLSTHDRMAVASRLLQGKTSSTLKQNAALLHLGSSYGG